jgi:transposase
MEVIYPSCCGLDVHAKTVVASLCIQGQKQIRTFTTMTDGLLQLSDWLDAKQVHACGHREHRGDWRPVFNILGGGYPDWVL